MRRSRILAYAGRRLLQAVPLILAVAVLNFLLLQIAPGDAAEVLAGEAGTATPEYMARLREEFGLDQPMHVQLWNMLLRLLQLDLGHSFRHGVPVLELILDRLPATLLLMLTTLGVSVLFGVLLGTLAARGANGVVDAIISVGAMIAYATPVFWIGLMMIVLFSVELRWLPSGGMTTITGDREGLALVADIAWHMILPVTTMSFFFIAIYCRIMRASVLNVMEEDYVTTARAKGLSELAILPRHTMRNALLPIVTLAGLHLSTLLGGSVLIETVFAWPGLGRLTFDAVFQRDLNLLLGILFVCSVLVVLMNLLVDLLYFWIDPRIEVD
ncbi:ABC transporter permease [Paralimibaculum aggregatum]|uniref:ABC transporter permease n=1 Tax=Paralimibaculum aggregatum TaxID=3036245 RepID=A0ABQ6LSH6_9RHOB|nr:ABC transporter permease [Limibaculum sp. NKW23]GMG85024.1 ABC transporter permease [Limibaculum sp. NKW23]